ncbi:MAG: CpaF family protein [Chloroflexota bacterium]
MTVNERQSTAVRRQEREFISTRELRKLIREKVYAKINPQELVEELRLNPHKVRRDLLNLVDQVVAEEGFLLASSTRTEMQHFVVDEILGLGPLDPMVRDQEIEEIMVNKIDEVWVARRVRGKVTMERTDIVFDDEEHVLHVVDRILGPIGRRVDEANPRVDARLKDGSRVNVIIPPLALDGPVITIRKFPERYLTVDDLVYKLNSLTPEACEFLETCVKGRLNILISGGTGSGKTTLLNALAGFINDQERIVTVEDTAELQVHKYKPHVVRLESRPPNIEGKGEVTIRDLVVNTLRMRPDRIVVGECRRGETVDMLQAMNTGHDGSLTTVHANSPEESIFRLENMFLMSGLDVPTRAIRQQIAMAIQLIVQLRRLPDGSRKVTHISEVCGMEGDTVLLESLYLYEDGELKDTGSKFQNVRKLKETLGRLPSLSIINRSL